MSRIAKNPVIVPKSIDVLYSDNTLSIKGIKGEMSLSIHPKVSVEIADNQIRVIGDKSDKFSTAMSGTIRSLISNMVTGVANGYEKRLILVGVGYRAQSKGSVLSLALGFSHPIDFEIPRGISIDTPSPTEIIIKGCDKQVVGQVAANIRSFRSPEPYKGKGIKYHDEIIIKKEAKKK